MNQYCPSCGEEVVEGLGNPTNDFLIIEELPDLCLPERPKSQFMRQKDEWTSKKVLNAELGKIGMDIRQFRIVSVYPHLPPESGIPVENCYNFGLGQVRLEMEGKQGIIIIGGNLCKEMSGFELKQVQGLTGVDFLLGYDAGDMPRAFLPNIRSIYTQGAGEFRIGLNRFAKMIGVL